MITTIIIHNKCDDESQYQQNPMIMPITKLTLTFLIESLHQIQFDQKQRQTFLIESLHQI
jgi:hypothetical protein